MSSELIIENSGWGEQVHQHEQELEGQLRAIIKSQRDREIEKMEKITMKATFETIEEIVNGPIYELRNDFWVEIREPYSNEII
jgi:hypothetical protein